jgi:hypothetical protein
MQGRQPDRPAEITMDQHWDLIERCWADVPTARPSADTIYQDIKQLLEVGREEQPICPVLPMHVADTGLSKNENTEHSKELLVRLSLYI